MVQAPILHWMFVRIGLQLSELDDIFVALYGYMINIYINTFKNSLYCPSPAQGMLLGDEV